MIDTKTKPTVRTNRDDFLADLNHHKPAVHRLTFGDGFRLGIGFITANLLILLLVGAVAYAIVIGLKLHN